MDTNEPLTALKINSETISANANNETDIPKESRIEFRHQQDTRRVFVKGGDATSRIHYNPTQSLRAKQPEDEDILVLAPGDSHARIPARRSVLFRTVQTIGALVSMAWFALCIVYFMGSVSEGSLWLDNTPYEMGIFIAGMIAPVAFFWMILSYMQRNSDVRYYAESLRNEMHTLFFPSSEDEDSRRVNRDIERMTMQAAEMATSAKAALKAIHRARQGLRHEIKEFVSLARKGEHHILGLADSMVERSAELNDMTSKIENRITVLNEKSDMSARMWDEAAARMVERASDIEIIMEKNAGRMLDVADKAEQKSRTATDMFDTTITSLGLTVDAVIDRLSRINDEFSAHTRTLEHSSEDLSKETDRLGQIIDNQVEQLQDAAGRSVETVMQSLIAVQDQKDILENTITTLSAKANDIAAVITGSVDRLDQSAETITTKAETIETRITDKSKMIALSLESFDEQISRIDTVSEQASYRLSESVDTIISGATQISEAVRKGTENLARVSRDSVTQASTIMSNATQEIDRLRDTSQSNIDRIEHMAGILEILRRNIEQSGNIAREHMASLDHKVNEQSVALGEATMKLADQACAVALALEEPVRVIGVAIADADGRHEQIQSTLERRINDLKEASDKAVNNVETIRHSLREQAQEITMLSGQVTSKSRILNEELAENKALLSRTVDSALQDITRILEDVSSAENKIGEVSGNVVSDLQKSNGTMVETLEKLRQTSKQAVDTLDKTIQEYESAAGTIEERSESMNRSTQKTAEQIMGVGEQIFPLYERVEEGANKALNDLKDLHDHYDETSESVLEKIRTVGDIFDERRVNLENGATEAANLLKSSGDCLADKLENIETAAKTADDRMRSISSVMKAQSSDIHIMTDQTILKIENIQKLINEQFVELAQAVDQAITRVEEAGDGFDTQSTRITVSADDILNRFAAAGDMAKTKADMLMGAANDVVCSSKETISAINEQISLLERAGENSLSNLTKTGDTLIIKSREIDANMRHVLEQSQNYAGQMREQVQLMASNSADCIDEINQNIGTLKSCMDNVNIKTKEVVSLVQDSNRSLYEQSGRFVTAVAKSVEVTEHATDMFSRQSDHMIKAAQIAVSKADEMRSTEILAQREVFISSARFVLESLHSLSIDFVRTLDGSVSDKSWKQYQKGDIALFTSQLAANMDQIPSDKIRNKYEQDTEFRSYVQKYMRHFEDIIDSAARYDRGSILSAAFMTSDVGRIYQYLCKVTGKEARTQQTDTKKAA